MSLARFERVDGILLEPLGEIWAAYSPASGETTLLNNESAALLEVLSAGPVNEAAVCAALADDCDLPAAELAVLVGCHWSRLIEAGLVRTRAADRLPTA